MPIRRSDHSDQGVVAGFPDELPGLPAGTGLTIVSWLLRGGSLLSPPLVGFIADLTSLRVGLLSVVLAGVITAALARVLVNRAPA